MKSSIMTIIEDYIFFVNLLKYGILCGDIYKAIFKIFFETKLSFNLLSVGDFFVIVNISLLYFLF